MDGLTTEMKNWLIAFQQNQSFIHSNEAMSALKHSAWPRKKATGAIAEALILRYTHPQCPAVDRNRLHELLVIAAQRGLDAQANCRGVPLQMLAHHYRLHDVLRHLELPEMPTLQSEVFLKGYMGALVKVAVNSLNSQLSADQLLERRNSPYRMQSALETLRQLHKAAPTGNISFQKLLTAIHRNGGKPRPADIKYGYRIKPGKTLPRIKQHLIHAAVVGYNLPLLRQMIEMGVKIELQDHYGRNILHLAHIVDAREVLRFIDSLPAAWKNKLSRARDGFGKTPKEIAEWKSINRSETDPLTQTQQNGWDQREIASLMTKRTDIDQIQAAKIDRKRFLVEHLSCLKPVLIKNALTPKHNLSKLCHKDAFYKHFGKTKVATGSIPYASTFQQPEKHGFIKDIQTDWDQYVFSPLSPSRDNHLISAFNCLDITNRLDNFNWQFYHGPANSGAPIHFHGDAWNLLVHGKKRWFLYQPPDGFYSTEPIRNWLNSPYPKAMEFTQEAGDLVYIPRYWAHGVINIKESIGIATEFNSPYIF